MYYIKWVTTSWTNSTLYPRSLVYLWIAFMAIGPSAEKSYCVSKNAVHLYSVYSEYTIHIRQGFLDIGTTVCPRSLMHLYIMSMLCKLHNTSRTQCTYVGWQQERTVVWLQLPDQLLRHLWEVPQVNKSLAQLVAQGPQDKIMLFTLYFFYWLIMDPTDPDLLLSYNVLCNMFCTPRYLNNVIKYWACIDLLNY